FGLKCTARKINSELEQRRRGNCRNGLEPVEDGGRHGFVHFENAQRGSSHAIAAELQSANIYSGLPEHRAHRADHSGNVAIMQHEEITLGHRLDAVAVDPGQAQRAISEHGAGDFVLAAAGANRECQGVDVISDFAGARFDNADSAFASDKWRVDVIEILVEEAAHQTLQNRGGDRVGLEIRGFTAKRQRQLCRRVGDQLRGESAQLFAKHEMRPENFEFLGGQRRDVNRLPNRAFDQEVGHLMRDIDRDLDLRLVGGGAEVRRYDHVIELEQRMVGGRWLLDEHVQSRARDLAGFQRLDERGFIDDTAAGAVDDSHALLHLRECRCVYETPRVVGQGRVDGDEIGARKKLIEADQLNAHAPGGFSRQDRIIANHFHLEPKRAVGDDPADVTEADYAERFVAYLGAGEFAALPFAGSQRGVGGWNMPRQRQHHGDRVLRGRDAVAGRAVHHDDSAARCRFDIDVVDADARAPDHLERRGGIDYFAGDARAAANQQRVVGRDYLRQLRGLEAGLDVELQLREALEDLDPLRRNRVAYEDAESVRHVDFKCSVPGAPERRLRRRQVECLRRSA